MRDGVDHDPRARPRRDHSTIRGAAAGPGRARLNQRRQPPTNRAATWDPGFTTWPRSTRLPKKSRASAAATAAATCRSRLLRSRSSVPFIQPVQPHRVAHDVLVVDQVAPPGWLQLGAKLLDVALGLHSGSNGIRAGVFIIEGEAHPRAGAWRRRSSGDRVANDLNVMVRGPAARPGPARRRAVRRSLQSPAGRSFPRRLRRRPASSLSSIRTTSIVGARDQRAPRGTAAAQAGGVKTSRSASPELRRAAFSPSDHCWRDDGDSRPSSSTSDVHVGVPASGSVRPAHPEGPLTLPWSTFRSTPSRCSSRTASSSWKINWTIATAQVIGEQRRWSASTPTTRRSSVSATPRPLRLRRPKGSRRARRAVHSDEPMDGPSSPGGARALLLQAAAHLGSPMLASSTTTTSTTSCAPPRSPRRRGTTCQGDQDLLPSSACRGGAESLSGVGAEYESRSSTTRCARTSRRRRRVHGHGLGLREQRTWCARTARTIIPSNDDRLAALNSACWSARLVRLRAAGVHVEHAAAGLLRIDAEHRQSSDADHRRPGLLRALRRGLAAEVWTTTPSTRRGRADRQDGARIRYATVQNFRRTSTTSSPGALRRDRRDGRVVDCNLGSKLTMKYQSVPSRHALRHGEVFSIAFADAASTQDVGAKIILGRRTRR